MYFMQVAREPLRLKFAPHVYGPYAENLRHVLRMINGHFIRVTVMEETDPIVGSIWFRALLATRTNSLPTIGDVRAFREGRQAC